MKIKNVFQFLFALFLFSACTNDSQFVSGQFDDSFKLISESDVFIAGYYVNEQEVKLVIEDLQNTSDNRNDPFPALDFIALRVDMNNNNEPDNNIDKSYSKSSNNTPCMQFVVQEGTAFTGCIAEEGYVYEARFSSSDSAEEEHVVYEILLRRESIFS